MWNILIHWKKYFQDSSNLRSVLFFLPHISCTYTRSSCPNKGTYWFHAKLPNIIQAVAHIWPHLRNEEYVGHRMVICNQLLHTFLTIWLVLCLFMKKKIVHPPPPPPPQKQKQKKKKQKNNKTATTTNKQTNKSFSPINMRMSSIPVLAYYGLLLAYCRFVTYTNN